MSPTEQHHFEWNDRLQDWLEGDLAGAAAAELEAHLGQCPICGERLGQLEQLDEALGAAAPDMALDASFDEHLFAQIDTIDEGKRAAARRRIEQELQQNLRELSRGWRRALAFMIPGVIAGIALAFAFTAWLDDSGLMRTLVTQAASQPGSGSFSMIQLSLTTLLGTSAGLIVARWLASVTE